MSTKLILIRHGETSLNAEKRYCGSIDIGLNLKGKKQSGKLCKRLKGVRIDKVYSSDRLRALETARIIFKRKKIFRTPGLREIHFGAFEGLKHSEILKRYPAIYKKWLDNPFEAKIPHAEGLKAFKKRVVASFKRIASANRNKTVAIVCHGGPVSIFINSIKKSGDFWIYIPRSTSITVIECKNNQTRLKSFNDIKHLSRRR